MSFSVNTQSMTIASGQSQSNAIRIGNQAVVGVVVPAGSSLTSLSFLGSVDNSNFYSITEDDGTEYNPTVAASKFVNLDLNQFLAPIWIKVRAGTNGSPSVQSVQQSLTLVLNEI